MARKRYTAVKSRPTTQYAQLPPTCTSGHQIANRSRILTLDVDTKMGAGQNAVSYLPESERPRIRRKLPKTYASQLPNE